MEQSKLWLVWIWAGALITVVVGLAAPANVLDRYPLLALFVERSGDLFPAVREYQETSAVPQVAALVAALACWFAPIQLVAAIWSGARKVIPVERIASMLKWSWIARLWAVVGMPIALLGAYWALFISSSDPGVCPGCANTTRVGLVLFVGLLPPALALVTHAYVAIARYSVFLLFSPRRQR